MQPDSLAAAELTAPQRTVLQAFVRSELRDGFYLTGGTALAGFYLGHRASDDLDLFTDGEVPMPAVEAFLKSIPGLSNSAYQRVYDRKVFVAQVGGAPLKIEFTRYPFPRAAPLARTPEGLAIDPPEEIFVNKVQAMVDRFEPKDDVDVFFLLRTPGMPTLAESAARAQAKFGLPGLALALQSRLLRVAGALPQTRPPSSREEIAEAFRKEALRLVSQSA